AALLPIHSGVPLPTPHPLTTASSSRARSLSRTTATTIAATLDPVIPRAFATLAAIVVPLLLTLDAIARLLPDVAWLGPAIAAACALPVVYAARLARGQALLGAALATMAAATSAELSEQLAITSDDEQELAVHDLRDGPLPAGRDGYVVVRGFLRGDWQVDEYRVAHGQRPDQNEQAEAVLVPLLGTNA